jgi:hypothetical protein
MIRFSSIVVLTCLLLACGCATSPKSGSQPCILPNEVAQPRLREVMDYLADNGFEEARNVYYFDFSAWPMYDRVCWENMLRKPRFEAATFDHDGARITIGVSPVKAYHSDGKEPEKLIPINPEDPAKPHGVSVVLDGRRWSVKYTLSGGTPELEKRLTELLQTYARDFAHQVDTDESLRSQTAKPLGQPALDMES